MSELPTRQTVWPSVLEGQGTCVIESDWGWQRTEYANSLAWQECIKSGVYLLSCQKACAFNAVHVGAYWTRIHCKSVSRISGFLLHVTSPGRSLLKASWFYSCFSSYVFMPELVWGLSMKDWLPKYWIWVSLVGNYYFIPEERERECIVIINSPFLVALFAFLWLRLISKSFALSSILIS